MSGRWSAARFASEYERQTTFDLMEREEGESIYEHAARNIRWFRDWAEETANHLQDDAYKLRGAP